MPTSSGKSSETMKLAIQLAMTVMLMAAARIELGNISLSSTQTIGPQVAAKNATKPQRATTAT